MKINRFSILLAAVFILATIACNKSSDEEPVPTIISSTHGSTKSHNTGQACLSCHQSGGSGASAGIFAVGGSVYNKTGSAVNPNGTLYFWSGPGGTGNLLATLQVDGNGNFYTTAVLIPGTGAYMQIKGTSGDSQTMPALNNFGNCNGCHGVTAPKIWVN